MDWPNTELFLNNLLSEVSEGSVPQRGTGNNSEQPRATTTSGRGNNDSEATGTTGTNTTFTFGHRQSNSLFTTPSPTRSETVRDDRSPTRETGFRFTDSSGVGEMGGSFGRDQSRAGGSNIWAASTPLARFGGAATDRRTPIPVRTTPAPSMQSATAFGGSVASPSTGSRVSGPQTGQTPLEKRMAAEAEDLRAMRARHGL
ncbi:hypothetical protein KC336_g15010 [Hortaea werneckii]|nr:hypothetical protein KC336_g15010 [Hortaea werneckii]